jgi:synaptotagmin-14/16
MAPIKIYSSYQFRSDTKESHEKFTPTGSSRYPYHENSSSDSEEEILRRLKLQQSISLQSGQIARYGGFSSPLNQSHLDGFQPISMDNGVSLTSSKPIKYSSSRTSSIYNNGHRYSGVSNNNGRDLLGQAERGKIGSHTSSECSSNSSVEASVESNMGLLNHEKKGEWEAVLERFKVNYSSPIADRRQVNPILDRAALRDSRIERRNSGSKSLRSSIVHQDSLEDVPDINSNQDVSYSKFSGSFHLIPSPSTHSVSSMLCTSHFLTPATSNHSNPET